MLVAIDPRDLLGQQDAELAGLCSAATFQVAVTQSPDWTHPSWFPSGSAADAWHDAWAASARLWAAWG